MSLREPSDAALRRWGLASLLSQGGIVLTGGAVRLTGSGLGCPTFPSCTDDSYVNTPEYGIHGYIEFGNRLLTFVLAVIALGTLVALFLATRRSLAAGGPRRGLLPLGVVLFLGVPAQALVGGVTVLTQLNPWVVMVHFMISAVLVVVATVLWHRSAELDGPARAVGPPPLRPVATGILGVSLVVAYLGTVVTGSGPHAGDADARRTGLDLELVTHAHAAAVYALVALTVALVVVSRRPTSPPAARRAALLLLVVELVQGAVGVVQFRTGVPELLVALHMLGAVVTVWAATVAWLTTRERFAADVDTAAERTSASVMSG